MRLVMVLIGAVGLLALAQQAPSPATQSSANQEANINAYVDLLRSDIRAGKVQILSSVMQFSPDEAAVFWPLYKAYDEEMRKEGDLRLAAMKEYSEIYDKLTDAKADELVAKFLALRSQREELLRKCYQQVRQKMGGKTAARFLQVESQLLHIIDLKIASLLPAIE